MQATKHSFDRLESYMLHQCYPFLAGFTKEGGSYQINQSVIKSLSFVSHEKKCYRMQ